MSIYTSKTQTGWWGPLICRYQKGPEVQVSRWDSDSEHQQEDHQLKREWKR